MRVSSFQSLCPVIGNLGFDVNLCLKQNREDPARRASQDANRWPDPA